MVRDYGGEGDGNYRRPYVKKVSFPMRLYTESGRPVTDKDGVLLLNIAGKPLARVDVHNFVFIDQRGRPLTDAANRRPKDVAFDPSTKPLYESPNDADLKVCSAMLFDVTGYPLTDMQGRPLLNRDGTSQLLFGPRGEPISDLIGGPLLDKMGRDIMKDERPLIDAHSHPLHIYDNIRRPLTDESGYSLLELSGVKLIVIGNQGYPQRVITGGEIHDSRGLTQNVSDFNLTLEGITTTSKVPIKTQNGRTAVAFDNNGHPLTDMRGILLCFATGEPMMKFNDHWYDWRGERAMVIRKDIFVRYSLRGFKNNSNVPIRLFDHKGRPFTDYQGAPQNHASGVSLIKFDEEGDPISDWLGRQLFDCYGYSEDNDLFRPCRSIKSQEILTKLFAISKKPIQYFDRFGLPLTNRYGIPLVNAKEELMIIFDSNGTPLHDIDGGPVFDNLGLPVTLKLEEPLLGPQKLPIRLYNSKGIPLTDHTGRILKHIRGSLLITVNPNGQIVCEHKGGELFDKKLRPTSFGVEFNACQTSFIEEKMDLVAKADGECLHLFDSCGYPLTDPNGVVLFDARGRALIKCPDQGFITTAYDEPVYDMNGFRCLRTVNVITKKSRAIYDKNSRPLTDSRGNVLKNRRGKDILVTKLGRPCEVLHGGRTYDSRNFPLDDPRSDATIAPTWETHIIGNGCQLFDCQDLPLTDEFGVVLYTSSGVPLIQMDSNGKAKCDHAGRSVFDKRAIPITRSSGYWRNQHDRPLRLYDKYCLPLTDLNGKELRDIGFRSLIRQDELGRPAFDNNNNLVNDSRGHCMTSAEFNPITFPPNKPVTLIEKEGGGLRIFDLDGRPLTDETGTVLVNSKGRPLVDTKNGFHSLTDIKGRRIYDVFWRPLGSIKDKPMLTVLDKPLLLFTEKGEPLTSIDGVPLCSDGNVSAVAFDQYGRPETTSTGAALYDSTGNQLKVYKTFIEPRTCLDNPEGVGTSFKFDDQGRPLTDECGAIVSYQGSPLSTKFYYLNINSPPLVNNKTSRKNKMFKKSIFN